jgi:hypothetical protein
MALSSVQVTVRGSLSRLNPTPYQIYCQSSLGPLVKEADAGTINQARPRVLHLGENRMGRYLLSGLSLEEFQTAHAKIFKAIDAKTDGKVTLEEMQMCGSPTSDQ